jgi:hypothetical protein
LGRPVLWRLLTRTPVPSLLLLLLALRPPAPARALPASSAPAAMGGLAVLVLAGDASGLRPGAGAAVAALCSRWMHGWAGGGREQSVK